MKTIITKRVKGVGQGMTISFPTINISLDSLPDGVDIGLYAGKVYKTFDWNARNAIACFSKTKEGFRGEIHVVHPSGIGDSYEVGDNVQLKIFSKLRDYKPITAKNRDKTIQQDKTLGTDFFKGNGKCSKCKFLCAADFGYSNYTVEGTTYSCLKKQFEDSDDSDVLFANESCQKFEKGEPWYLDVDGESQGPTEEWLKENNC